MQNLALRFAFFALIAAVAMPANAAGDDKAGDKAVLDALDAWKTAMVKKDRAAFEKLYHPDLVYAHSSGKTEDKAAAIAAVVDGPSSWDAINLVDTKVKLSGKTAIVTGRMEYHQRENGGAPQLVNLVVMTTWTKAGKGWQMLSRQAAKLPAPAPVAATAK
ncbi:MAG TPA: nuclear transport factor 2 family protein [Polyangia bacterium]